MAYYNKGKRTLRLPLNEIYIIKCLKWNNIAR